jgi:hypothetical protein
VGDSALRPKRLELPALHDTGQLCIIPSTMRLSKTKVNFKEWKASAKARIAGQTGLEGRTTLEEKRTAERRTRWMQAVMLRRTAGMFSE